MGEKDTLDTAPDFKSDNKFLVGTKSMVKLAKNKNKGERMVLYYLDVLSIVRFSPW